MKYHNLLDAPGLLVFGPNQNVALLLDAVNEIGADGRDVAVWTFSRSQVTKWPLINFS